MEITSKGYINFDPSLPPQNAMVTSRAVLKDHYALIPGILLIDFVKGNLPFWEKTSTWVLASPAIGSGVRFVESLIKVEENGGSSHPEDEEGVENFLFILAGKMVLGLGGETHLLHPGGFAFISAGTSWTCFNTEPTPLTFLWFRKQYEPLPGHTPRIIIGNENDIPQIPCPGTDGKVRDQYLIPLDDISYDMNININNWDPGSILPMTEVHYMEHGLYMLQGQGVYLLGDTWYEVTAGDFIWMSAFCPQSFYAAGPVPARYLLYKNMNRHIPLRYP
jgi:(S)-ureidoglycine aminohydrolase